MCSVKSTWRQSRGTCRQTVKVRLYAENLFFEDAKRVLIVGILQKLLRGA